MQHDGRFLNGLTLEDVSVSTQAEKGTLRVWEEAAGPRPLPETLGGGGCVCVGCSGGGGAGPQSGAAGSFLEPHLHLQQPYATPAEQT